jgi:death-on-curing protein
LPHVEYLTLADFLLIAETATGIAAEEFARLPKVALAESALAAPAASYGGVELYPTLVEKAAVLCARIVRNHRLPDGNKRTGFLSLVEFVERNGGRWRPSDGDPKPSWPSGSRPASPESGGRPARASRAAGEISR